jgi:parallel beta-helix repeat protein
MGRDIMKKYCLVGFFIMLFLIPTRAQSVTMDSSSHINHRIQIVDSLVIASDAELEEISTSGSGTPLDPYVLSGIVSETTQSSIKVSNTRRHFVIKDSLIWFHLYFGVGIHFSNVSHGSLIDSTVRGAEIGVLIEDSFNCSISGVAVDDCDYGVQFSHSFDCSVTENRFFWGGRGIYLDKSNYTFVTGNVIVHNDEYGIAVDGQNNTIFGNEIGWNVDNAADFGQLNQWDNGISVGNSWSDYSGEGNYSIHGFPGIADKYPTLMVENDYQGPEVNHSPPHQGVIDAVGPPMSQLHLEVNVSDLSGVDTVLLWRFGNGEWTRIEMTHHLAAGDCEIYAFTLEGPFTYLAMTYYIWANDSEGYSSRSRSYGFSWGTNPMDYTLGLFVGAILIIAASLVIALRRYRR